MPLAAYLAAVGAAITAGMPPRSWVEATVAAVKASAWRPLARARRLRWRRLRRRSSGRSCAAPIAPVSRNAWAHGSALDLLVGMTIVVQVAPEFHPQWHLGCRITGMAASVRESLLRRALEKVRAQLKREGLYDAQRRLPVPADVTRVAVVHPAGAAGCADIASELARWPCADICVTDCHSHPARFEGPHAAGEIALADIGRATWRGQDVRPDVVLICQRRRRPRRAPGPRRGARRSTPSAPVRCRSSPVSGGAVCRTQALVGRGGLDGLRHTQQGPSSTRGP